MFFFLILLSTVYIQCENVIKIYRFGVDSSCLDTRNTTKYPITQLPIGRCFFYGEYYVELSYGMGTILFSSYSDQNCTELEHSTVYLENSCYFIPFFYERDEDSTSVYSKFVHDEEVDPTTENSVVEKYFAGRVCHGDVQFSNILSSDCQAMTNSRFLCDTNSKVYKIREIEGAACENLLDREYKGMEDMDQYYFLQYGCEYLKHPGEDILDISLSKKFYCGDLETESQMVDERVNDNLWAFYEFCFTNPPENCTSQNYDMAFVLYFDECRYDYAEDAFFKYVRCNQFDGVMQKEFYTRSYCRGEVDYYLLEYVYENFAGITARKLICDLQEPHTNDKALFFHGYIDDQCLIRSDRDFFFPISGECKMFRISFEGLMPWFGMMQECESEKRIRLEVQMGGCEPKENGFIPVSMRMNVSETCDQLDSYLLDFEPRFPYTMAQNPEFCRTCNGVHHYRTHACSSHGNCIAQDECVCEREYAGKFCEEASEVKQIKDFIANYWWVFLLCFIVCVFVVVFTTLLVIFSGAMYSVRRKRKLVVKYAPKDEDEEVTILFTDIQNSTNLYERDSTLMLHSIALHNDLMRQMIRKYKAYEVKTIGDAFMVAFHSPVTAVLWALDVQNELVKLEYEKGFLYLPDCGAVENRYGEIMFRGLRVRMGMHCGPMQIEYSAKRNQFDYMGNNVNFASRTESSAPGGCIFITEDVLEKVKDADFSSVGGGVKFQNVGMWSLKGIEGQRNLHCVYQKERKYEARAGYKDAVLKNSKSQPSSSGEFVQNIDDKFDVDDYVVENGDTSAEEEEDPLKAGGFEEFKE